MGIDIKPLGDAELEIMLVIWDIKEPVTSNYVLENLHTRRHWQLSTLMTVLARLEKKGFVRCDRSTRTNYYSPSFPKRNIRRKKVVRFWKDYTEIHYKAW